MTVEVTMEQVYQLIGELFVENKMRATIQEKQKAQLVAYAQELVKAREQMAGEPPPGLRSPSIEEDYSGTPMPRKRK